jgi:hypothetical protein
MKYRKSLPFLGVPGVERFEMESSGYVQRGKKPRRKFWVATSIFWKFGKEANLDELNTSTGLGSTTSSKLYAIRSHDFDNVMFQK